MQARRESETERVGVLGGTFDPPHYGHLALAEAARDQLALDSVLFVPAGQPPHKPESRANPAEQRAAMVALAIAGNPAFVLSRVDLDRPGPHYTAHMLALLREQLPRAELFFVMGTDSLVELPGWHTPDAVLRLAALAVLQRPGTVPDMSVLERLLPGLRERVLCLDAPRLDISSSELRDRVRRGRSIRYLLPCPVLAYVHEHGLYRA